MRIIGILTYRAAKNRYVSSNKGRSRARMDTQERRHYLRTRSNATVLWVLVGRVKSDGHTVEGSVGFHLCHFSPHISFSVNIIDQPVEVK